MTAAVHSAAVRWSRRGAALALATLLAACATSQRTATPGEDAWTGRLALQVESEPPQSFSAGFDLRGTPAAGELRLASPLGSTLALLTWNRQGAELRQGNQTTRRDSLDALTAELAGTEIPVAALFDWLRGQAHEAPGWQADLSRQAEGRVTARRSAPAPAAELRLVFLP